MKRYTNIKIIFAAVFTIAVMGCGTVSKSVKPDCFIDDLILRWGGHNHKENILSGYQIDSEAFLYKFIKDSLHPNYNIEKIGEVDKDRFCELLKTTKKLFIEIQALNAPGDSSNFVEFLNPGTNTNLRAVWNVRFQTFGSKEFRALFDSLNLFVVKNEDIMNKKGKTPDNSIK